MSDASSVDRDDRVPRYDAPFDSDALDLQAETLSGDLRDAMLAELRNLERPWSKLTEAEQRDLADRIEAAATGMTRAAARVIVDYDWPSAAVMLSDVKIIGGDKSRIEGKVTAGNIEHNRNVLGDAVGGAAMLVCVDPQDFHGERGPAAVEPDQPQLPDSGAA